MSAPLSLPAAVAPAALAPRKIAPIRQAAQAAASLVTRPAMARDEVSAAQALREEQQPPPHAFRTAALAAGAAFAGSAVGLAFFLSRKPTVSAGGSHAKFRA